MPETPTPTRPGGLADTTPSGPAMPDRIRTIDDLVEVRDYVTTVAAALCGISRNFDSDAADAVLRVAYEAGAKLQAVIDRLYGRDDADGNEGVEVQP